MTTWRWPWMASTSRARCARRLRFRPGSRRRSTGSAGVVAKAELHADIDQRHEGVADRRSRGRRRRARESRPSSGCSVSTIAVSGTTSVWPATETDHAVEHGQRQRQAHRECRAVARPRRDRDAPAERLDRALHHVHADAAAGNVRDRRRRREARQEDQIVDLARRTAARRRRSDPS